MNNQPEENNPFKIIKFRIELIFFLLEVGRGDEAQDTYTKLLEHLDNEAENYETNS